MKMINENTVKVAVLIVQIAIIAADGVKYIVGLFKKKNVEKPL